MDSSVSPKDEIWFLRVCHYISNAVYLIVLEYFLVYCETKRAYENVRKKNNQHCNLLHLYMVKK